jgi:hypothetical protein
VSAKRRKPKRQKNKSLSPPPPPEQRQARRTPLPSGRALAGGRLSLDNETGWFESGLTVLAPMSADAYWRDGGLDASTFDLASPAKILELLADLSPDVSRALWDFLRLYNPGWEAKAYRPGGKEQDKQAQAALDAFIATLADLHGSFDVVLNRLGIGAFLRGAFCAELVLNKTGRIPVDLATPDPGAVRFRRVTDPERGPVWQPGQWHGGEWVALDRITVRYVPVDPLPGSPYGRALASPAIFPTLFLIGLLHDLRRVVAQQGYPRLDLEISIEKLKEAMPADLESDADKMKAWIDATTDDIQAAFNSLEPDDAYVHLDVVKINRAVGAVDSSSLGAVGGLIEALERMAVRALKSMPLLMGTTDGVSEANSVKQFELMASGIKSIQHLCENMLERLLGLALQAQGIGAKVEFRFAELRAAEMMRDAQTEALLIANAARKRDEGWVTQDEAANEVVGHPPAEEAPLAQLKQPDPALMEDPEPASGRMRLPSPFDATTVLLAEAQNGRH